MKRGGASPGTFSFSSSCDPLHPQSTTSGLQVPRGHWRNSAFLLSTWITRIPGSPTALHLCVGGKAIAVSQPHRRRGRPAAFRVSFGFRPSARDSPNAWFTRIIFRALATKHNTLHAKPFTLSPADQLLPRTDSLKEHPQPSAAPRQVRMRVENALGRGKDQLRGRGYVAPLEHQTPPSLRVAKTGGRQRGTALSLPSPKAFSVRHPLGRKRIRG